LKMKKRTNAVPTIEGIKKYLSPGKGIRSRPIEYFAVKASPIRSKSITSTHLEHHPFTVRASLLSGVLPGGQYA